ncbi:hypothetical protein [Rheinheimera oceanensis]|uniref:hypothetical protein n=1 Tax=Rheinheimera oceanensis TaxID=2817449 RepID=UPI001BFDA3B0|nr:hypothetical protein [Rheinheimera oceanensis]
MEQLTSDLVNTHWLIAAVVISISLVSGLIKVIRAVIDTHDELYLKRDLKRLAEVKANISVGSKVAEYIDKRIEEEAFVLASGIRASIEDADMLRELYLKNFLTSRQLKRIAKYVKPVNGKIAIEFGWFDKSQTFYSFWASIILFILGFSGIVPLIAEPSLLHALFAITMFGVALSLIWFVGSDFQRYKTLYFVWCRLKTENQLANPDAEVKTKGVYTPTYQLVDEVGSNTDK